MNDCRSRGIYGFAFLLIIGLGLASRKFASIFPDFLDMYLGDALWAAMIFAAAGFIFSAAKTKNLALGSIVFCYCIELSQLYHAAWIDSIRATRLGGLVLGYGFLWSDLVAYAIGVAFAVILEMIYKKSFYKVC